MTAWLAGIVISLLSYPGFFDVALREVGLLLGALILACLAQACDPAWYRRHASAQPTADAVRAGLASVGSA